jgi:hypothetical protein
LSRQDHNQHDAELEKLRARVAELESNKKDKRGERAWDILIGLVFTGVPFGFGVPILYACVSWAVAWVAFVRLFWNLSRMRNWTKVGVALAASVVLVWITYGHIRVTYIKEKARATSGDLVAKDDGKDHSSDYPILQIGPNGQMQRWTGASDTPIAAYYDKIQVKMVNGRVQLSTTIRDDNKNLIADITDNHWTVSSSTASCWDKNYTDDSLEVKDGHGRVVLQVKVMPNIVQIQEEWQWNPGTKSGAISQTGKYDEKNGIKRIFKYPSELYWGQLEPSPY